VSKHPQQAGCRQSGRGRHYRPSARCGGDGLRKTPLAGRQ
jgi:hypothetical protein